MNADHDAPCPDGTVSETIAAQRVGWTAANLRSHRLRHEAQLAAQVLDPALAERVRRWSSRDPARIGKHDRDRLVQLGMMDRDNRPTPHGIEVARRLRNGDRRQSPPPPPHRRMGKRGLIRYEVEDLDRWLADNQQILNREQIASETIDQHEAARFLGIRVSTLKSLRSKAARAKARIDAGDEQPGDQQAARRSPPWVWSGSEKRYQLAEVERWAKTRRQRDQGPDPLLRQRDRQRGELLGDDETASLMGIEVQCLPGYRSRARRALRWLVANPDASGKALASAQIRAQTCPPHAIIDGRRWYQAADVQDWRKARRPNA